MVGHQGCCLFSASALPFPKALHHLVSLTVDVLCTLPPAGSEFPPVQEPSNAKIELHCVLQYLIILSLDLPSLHCTGMQYVYGVLSWLYSDTVVTFCYVVTFTVG